MAIAYYSTFLFRTYRTKLARIEMVTKISPLPTYQNNLPVFISQLREYLHLSQEEVAAYFCLHRSRISRYENSSVKENPKIGYLAGLAQLVVEQANDEPEIQQTLLREVNEAVRRHYRQRRFQNWAALCDTAATYLTRQRAKLAAKSASIAALADKAKHAWLAKLEKRLDLPPSVQLIGVEDHLNHLSDLLISLKAPWVICISGLGGIGKTSLAGTLIRQPWIPNRFHNTAWTSAKQQSFSPGARLEQLAGPTLNAAALTDALLEQLDSHVLLSQPPDQKRAALKELLKKGSHLIVVDNLESLEDYQALLPTLLKLANPSKFLLTSRHSLQTHPDIFILDLEELSQPDTFRFIKHEAELRGFADLISAPEDQLQSIYEVVGGNPLALKLVVGQVSVLSLSRVLENLKKAKSQKIEDLYNFIYWQAWQMLDEVDQQVFLAMPTVEAATVDQLVDTTQLGIEELNQALEKLAELSLVQVGGDLYERRYTIHRLTETFLLCEALQWKTSA